MTCTEPAAHSTRTRQLGQPRRTGSREMNFRRKYDSPLAKSITSRPSSSPIWRPRHPPPLFAGAVAPWMSEFLLADAVRDESR